MLDKELASLAVNYLIKLKSNRVKTNKIPVRDPSRLPGIVYCSVCGEITGSTYHRCNPCGAKYMREYRRKIKERYDKALNMRGFPVTKKNKLIIGMTRVEIEDIITDYSENVDIEAVIKLLHEWNDKNLQTRVINAIDEVLHGSIFPETE